MFEFAFMQRALIAALIIGLICGVLGSCWASVRSGPQLSLPSRWHSVLPRSAAGQR